LFLLLLSTQMNGISRCESALWTMFAVGGRSCNLSSEFAVCEKYRTAQSLNLCGAVYFTMEGGGQHDFAGNYLLETRVETGLL